MVKIEELKLDDGDDDFVTESESSSKSDPSEVELADHHQSSSDSGSDDDDDDDEEEEEEKDLERTLELYRVEDESIADRIYALRDIINPSTRASICQCWNSFWDKSTSTGKALGNFTWVMTTSIILVGLPMALSIEAESMLVAQEKEMERQQQGQQTLTTPGTGLGTNSVDQSPNRVPSVFS